MKTNNDNSMGDNSKGAECCGGHGDCHGEHMMMMGHKHRGRMGVGFVALAAGVFFIMLSIFIGIQIWGNSWFKNIKAEITSQPYARTITVDGEGKITAKPDIARISLSVVSAGKTVKVVTEDGNKKMNAVIAELKKLGIKSEDIQTSEYNLYPQYDYKPLTVGQSSYPIIGYSLNQTVDVKVRDLTLADDVLDKATLAGANQIGSLTFDIDDTSKVKNEARLKAFQAASDKAQQMATAAGVKIGRVITFSEGFNYPVPMANFSMKAMDGGVAESSVAAVEPGSKEMTVTVSVTYEIE